MKKLKKNNFKRTISSVLAAVLLLASTGCAPSDSDDGKTSEQTQSTTSANTISTAYESSDSDFTTVVDHIGNSVNVPKEINRIAVCGIYPLPSVLSVFFNSADKIVGMPPASMTAAANGLLGEVYPEILNAETGYTDGSSVNVEELMKLEPDIVFYSDTDKEIGDQLINAGFTAVAVSVSKWDYDCIETLNNWIDLLSQIFPENNRVSEVEEYGQKSLDLISERVSSLSDEDKARVFILFQYTDTNIVTSGKHFFGQWWCDASGAVNVANELENDNSVAVNMEQVMAWNPEVILVTNFTTAQPDDLYNNTFGSYDWSGIDAVVNRRVYKMPLGLYRSYTPGADVPVSLLWVAKTIYPDLFDDIDVTAEAKEYYKNVFGLELSDEQIESIFNPVSSAGEVADTTK